VEGGPKVEAYLRKRMMKPRPAVKKSKAEVNGSETVATRKSERIEKANLFPPL
jgi:hypothetical protein